MMVEREKEGRAIFTFSHGVWKGSAPYHADGTITVAILINELLPGRRTRLGGTINTAQNLCLIRM